MHQLSETDFQQSKASGNLQDAIEILHKPLKEFINQQRKQHETAAGVGRQTPTKEDFSQLVEVIQNEWTDCFRLSNPPKLLELAERALKICNRVAHENFNFNEYQHSIESLAELALFIRRPDVEEVIRQLYCPPQSKDQCTESSFDEEWLRFKEAMSEKLTTLEEEEGLSHEDMSLQSLINRLVALTTMKERLKDLELSIDYKAIVASMPELTLHCDALHEDIGSWIPQMVVRAFEGSKTARTFLHAMGQFGMAEELVKTGNVIEGFRILRLSSRLWDLPFYDTDLFSAAAVKVLEENPNDAEALFVLANINTSLRDNLVKVQRCVELDPTVADYHYLLGNLYGFCEEYKQTVREVERALELDLCPNWLYSRAAAMYLDMSVDACTVERMNVAKAFQDYLDHSPPDGRKVPEAYYTIGSIYLFENDLEKAEQYWQKGIAAEDPSVRLPCFRPVEENFPRKTNFRYYLTIKQLSVGAQAKASCKKCGKRDGTKRCSACRQVFYCSKECQAADWKVHKKTCKTAI